MFLRSPVAWAADRWRRSLSAKLFILTTAFVLLIEAVILAPSVAHRYHDFLIARIETAYLVSLALEAPEVDMIDEETAEELFATSNIAAVSVSRGGARFQILAPSAEDAELEPRYHLSLSPSAGPNLIMPGWSTLLSRSDGFVSVTGTPMRNREEQVDILVSESAIRNALKTYTVNILGLSLLISGFTAFAVYAALDRIIVRPVCALTDSMAAFERDPDRYRHATQLSGRVDEIGEAERGLVALESRVRAHLAEQRRLAALGAGISKISHDLRNILASAQLMSDRLAASEDPRVRKLSPRLIAALDRAIALSRDTLSYARMAPETLQKSPVSLQGLVEDVFDDAASLHVAFRNEVPEDLSIVADRNQLYRAVFNIVRNAVEALEPLAAARPGEIVATVAPTAKGLDLDIADNGPGLPPEAREFLFDPFKGSRKPGGSGLGVAIAHEILAAHGGELSLEKSDADGATFRFHLPR